MGISIAGCQGSAYFNGVKRAQLSLGFLRWAPCSPGCSSSGRTGVALTNTKHHQAWGGPAGGGRHSADAAVAGSTWWSQRTRSLSNLHGHRMTTTWGSGGLAASPCLMTLLETSGPLWQHYVVCPVR